MEYPKSFDKQAYSTWHEAHFGEKNVEQIIVEYRDDLKARSEAELVFLNELLYQVIPMAEYDYKTDKGVDIDVKFPLKEAVKDKTSNRYDLLFKSSDSIIDKLWRLNKSDPKVHTKNLEDNIGDLVRTEIICPTLASCEYLAKRIERINLPSDYDITKQLNELVETVHFEPEMKMASGYFAYHVEMKFVSGFKVEIQIYSALSGVWRTLSHLVYEKSRLGVMPLMEFASSEARLVSLGHLLHLAECEIQRLENEIK